MCFPHLQFLRSSSWILIKLHSLVLYFYDITVLVEIQAISHWQMNTLPPCLYLSKNICRERVSPWLRWPLKPCADLIRPHDTFTVPDPIMRCCPAWIPKYGTLIVARGKLLTSLLPSIFSYCWISAPPRAADLMAWGTSSKCCDAFFWPPALYCPRRQLKENWDKLVGIINKTRIDCEHNLTLVRLSSP